MTIKDNKGKTLKVTDLNKAINQAENFKSMYHIDQNRNEINHKKNKELQIYWEDIYNKLISLK